MGRLQSQAFCCSAAPHTFLAKHVTKLHANSVHEYMQSCACHGGVLVVDGVTIRRITVINLFPRHGELGMCGTSLSLQSSLSV